MTLVDDSADAPVAEAEAQQNQGDRKSLSERRGAAAMPQTLAIESDYTLLIH